MSRVLWLMSLIWVLAMSTHLKVLDPGLIYDIQPE
ncbi:hypothetical protein LINGRAHAP2_LOCUS2411 [Linum grandiflorum]